MKRNKSFEVKAMETRSSPSLQGMKKIFYHFGGYNEPYEKGKPQNRRLSVRKRFVPKA